MSFPYAGQQPLEYLDLNGNGKFDIARPDIGQPHAHEPFLLNNLDSLSAYNNSQEESILSDGELSECKVGVVKRACSNGHVEHIDGETLAEVGKGLVPPIGERKVAIDTLNGEFIIYSPQG